MTEVLSDFPSEPVFAYRMLGLLVHSAFELPELPGAQEDSGQPEIVIQKGAVSAGSGILEAEEEDAPYVVRPDRFFLERSHVGRYEVKNGETITVDVCSGVADVDVRVYLLGSVFGALCHQRGLLPLHASAIVHEGRAYAFGGPSGTGKSTISAGLCQRGFGFVADDVCPIDAGANRQPQILPSVRKLKLSEDSLRTLGFASEGHVRDHEDSPRYHVPVAEAAPSLPVPLHAVYMFRRVEEGPDLRIEEIPPAHAVRCLQHLTYMPRYPLAADRVDEHFLSCASLAARVALFEVFHRPGLERLADMLDGLSDHLRNTAPVTA